MFTSPTKRHWPAAAQRSLVLLMAAAGVFLAAMVSLAFAGIGGGATPIWLANAVMLALAARAEPRRWPELLAAGFLGNLLASLVHGAPLAQGAAVSACNMLQAGIAAALLRRLIGPAMDMTRRRDLAILTAVAFCAAAASAVAAATVLGLVRGEAVLLRMTVWTLADAIGLIMVTPVLLMAGDVRAQLLARRPSWRQGLSLVVLAAGTAAVFGQSAYPLIFVVPPLWAYAVAELEFVGLTAGAVIVGAVSLVLTALGHGPTTFVRGDSVHRLLLLQGFIAFSTLALLEFTAGVVQRRRLTESLERVSRQAELRRAGAVEHSRRAQMAESVAGLGYWRKDLKTGVVEWSAQIYALFGLPRSTQPQTFSLTELIHPDDRAEAEAAFQHFVATGESRHAEARVITPDGRLRILRSWSAAEFDTKGQVAAIMYALMDVTEQRRVESELRQARDAAEQAAEVKAEFLANMSHELRTPLTSILGFTALAAAEADMPETVRHYIDRVGLASKALLTLVNDVLDFSKLEAGEIRLEPRPVDMPALASEVLSLFEGQAAAKGLRLQLDLADGVPPAVAVDSDRVRQVLLNLMGNAVKFTGEGEVTLQLGYDAEAELLSAAVVDTGPGIGADRHQRLFQRFSQVDGSSTRTFGGTGLGLAICKGLVEAMGGEIGVDTREGVGSRFWFEIPAAAVDPVAAASASAAVAALSLGNRFLVVDDNRANRDLVRAILASLGADIVEAEDGRAGVQAAMELPFDVILMDMRMPGLSGEEAVAEIRRGGPNAACPIIAFSASADAGQLEQLRRLGFDACLPKPFTLTDLIRAVETALAACEAPAGVRRHA